MSISPSGNLHVIFYHDKNIISQVSVENLINQYRNVLLPRSCGRITTLFAKIKFKMLYFFKMFKFMICFYVSSCVISNTRCLKNQRNKKKKRFSTLERRGCVEGFQTSTRLRGYMRSLYPTCDI